jgi:hypothetical protein
VPGHPADRVIGADTALSLVVPPPVSRANTRKYTVPEGATPAPRPPPLNRQVHPELPAWPDVHAEVLANLVVAFAWMLIDSCAAVPPFAKTPQGPLALFEYRTVQEAIVKGETVGAGLQLRVGNVLVGVAGVTVRQALVRAYWMITVPRAPLPPVPLTPGGRGAAAAAATAAGDASGRRAGSTGQATGVGSGGAAAAASAGVDDTASAAAPSAAVERAGERRSRLDSRTAGPRATRGACTAAAAATTVARVLADRTVERAGSR